MNNGAKVLQGSKARVTPNTVVFQSPRAFRDIYNARANIKRSKMYDSWQRNEDDVNTLSTSDMAVHARKRRILNTVFTEVSVRAAGQFINKHVDRWNELLPDGAGKDWSQPKNMTDWSDYLVFDILGDLCFGRSFEIKEPGDNPFREIPHAIHSYLKFQYPVSL